MSASYCRWRAHCAVGSISRRAVMVGLCNCSDRMVGRRSAGRIGHCGGLGGREPRFVAHAKNWASAAQRGEQRRLGAGEPGLAPSASSSSNSACAAGRVEMGGDLVEQQQRRLRPALGRSARRMREHDGDQQRLLLAGRAERRPGMPVSAMDDGEIAAVRAQMRRRRPRHRPRASRPARPRSRSSAASAGISSSQPSTAPASAQARPRERRPRLGARPRRGRRPARAGRPRWRRRARPSAARARRARRGSRPPARPRPQQPRALAQRLLVGVEPRRHGSGSRPSTSRSRKRRRSPGASRNSRSICGVSQTTASRSAERRLAARRARRRCCTQPPLALLAAAARIAPGAELDRARRPVRELRGDAPRRRARPRLGAAGRAVDLGQPRLAQAAAGGQERDRLQQVGLAGAVGAGQHHRPPIQSRVAASRIVAEIGERQPAPATATRPGAAPALPQASLCGG